jgi:DNA repair protein RadC
VPPGAFLIRELPETERPRERIYAQGCAALSDVELVAVLLRTGARGRSSLQIAIELLKEHGGLAGLLDRRPPDLERAGLGKAKAATVLAAVEIGRRLTRVPVSREVNLRHPLAVVRHVRMTYARRDQEVMGAFLLDTRGRLLAERELYRGTINRAAVEPREVLKEALLAGAVGVVLFHTHPSGDPTPSLEDLEFTRQLADACKVVGLKLMDHLIVGHAGSWTSLRERDPW